MPRYEVVAYEAWVNRVVYELEADSPAAARRAVVIQECQDGSEPQEVDRDVTNAYWTSEREWEIKEVDSDATV